MEVSIMIRQTERGTFRATVALPEVLSVEAATRDDALHELSEQIRGQLSGVEFVTLEMPLPIRTNPWLEAAGTWANHPDIDDLERNIRDYRRQVDEDAMHP